MTFRGIFIIPLWLVLLTFFSSFIKTFPSLSLPLILTSNFSNTIELLPLKLWLWRGSKVLDAGIILSAMGEVFIHNWLAANVISFSVFQMPNFHFVLNLQYVLLWVIHLVGIVIFSLVLKAAQLYAKALIGRTTDEIFGDFGRVWRELARESQFRWVC